MPIVDPLERPVPSLRSAAPAVGVDPIMDAYVAGRPVESTLRGISGGVQAYGADLLDTAGYGTAGANLRRSGLEELDVAGRMSQGALIDSPDVGTFLRRAPGAIASSVLPMAGILGGQLLGGKAGALAVGSVMGAGEQAGRFAQDPTAMANSTAEERALYGAGSGVVQGAMDMIVPGRLAAARPGAGRALAEFGKDLGIEAATETGQTLTTQAGHTMLNPFRDKSGDTHELAESAVQGALGGGTFGAAHGAIAALPDVARGVGSLAAGGVELAGKGYDAAAARFQQMRAPGEDPGAVAPGGVPPVDPLGPPPAPPAPTTVGGALGGLADAVGERAMAETADVRASIGKVADSFKEGTIERANAAAKKIKETTADLPEETTDFVNRVADATRTAEDPKGFFSQLWPAKEDSVSDIRASAEAAEASPDSSAEGTVAAIKRRLASGTSAADEALASRFQRFQEENPEGAARVIANATRDDGSLDETKAYAHMGATMATDAAKDGWEKTKKFTSRMNQRLAEAISTTEKPSEGGTVSSKQSQQFIRNPTMKRQMVLAQKVEREAKAEELKRAQDAEAALDDPDGVQLQAAKDRIRKAEVEVAKERQRANAELLKYEQDAKETEIRNEQVSQTLLNTHLKEEFKAPEAMDSLLPTMKAVVEFLQKSDQITKVDLHEIGQLPIFDQVADPDAFIKELATQSKSSAQLVSIKLAARDVKKPDSALWANLSPESRTYFDGKPDAIRSLARAIDTFVPDRNFTLLQFADMLVDANTFPTKQAAMRVLREYAPPSGREIQSAGLIGTEPLGETVEGGTLDDGEVAATADQDAREDTVEVNDKGFQEVEEEVEYHYQDGKKRPFVSRPQAGRYLMQERGAGRVASSQLTGRDVRPVRMDEVLAREGRTTNKFLQEIRADAHKKASELTNDIRKAVESNDPEKLRYLPAKRKELGYQLAMRKRIDEAKTDEQKEQQVRKLWVIESRSSVPNTKATDEDIAAFTEKAGTKAGTYLTFKMENGKTLQLSAQKMLAHFKANKKVEGIYTDADVVDAAIASVVERGGEIVPDKDAVAHYAKHNLTPARKHEFAVRFTLDNVIVRGVGKAPKDQVTLGMLRAQTTSRASDDKRAPGFDPHEFTKESGYEKAGVRVRDQNTNAPAMAQPTPAPQGKTPRGFRIPEVPGKKGARPTGDNRKFDRDDATTPGTPAYQAKQDNSKPDALQNETREEEEARIKAEEAAEAKDAERFRETQPIRNPGDDVFGADTLDTERGRDADGPRFVQEETGEALRTSRTRNKFEIERGPPKTTPRERALIKAQSARELLPPRQGALDLNDPPGKPAVRTGAIRNADHARALMDVQAASVQKSIVEAREQRGRDRAFWDAERFVINRQPIPERITVPPGVDKAAYNRAVSSHRQLALRAAPEITAQAKAAAPAAAPPAVVAKPAAPAGPEPTQLKLTQRVKNLADKRAEAAAIEAAVDKAMAPKELQRELAWDNDYQARDNAGNRYALTGPVDAVQIQKNGVPYLKPFATAGDAMMALDVEMLARVYPAQSNVRGKQNAAAASNGEPTTPAVKQSLFGNMQSDMTGAAEVDPAEQAATIAEVRRMLGKNLTVVFKDLLVAGESHTWHDKDGKIEREAIELGLHLNPGLSRQVAYHEAMHSFLERLRDSTSSPRMRRMAASIERAANSPGVRKQLRELLAEKHPAAWRQVQGSNEEAAAYMFQFWQAGLLEVAPDARDVFERIAKFIRSIFGVVSENEQAVEMMSRLQTGDFAEISTVGQVVEDMREETFRDRMDRWAPIVAKYGRAFTFAATDRLRDFGSPVLAEVANLFHRDPGHELDQTGDLRAKVLGKGAADIGSIGYLQRAEQQKGMWKQRLNKVLLGSSAEHRKLALAILQGAPPKAAGGQHMFGSAAATQAAGNLPAGTPAEVVKMVGETRVLLAEMYDYMHKAGVSYKVMNSAGQLENVRIRKQDNYFPRVWNAEYVRDNAAALTTLFKKYGVSNVAAKKIIEKLQRTGQDEVLGEAGFTPFNRSANALQLTFINDANRHEFARFMQPDLVETLASYVSQGVHRAEYTRYFGGDGEVLKEALKRAKLNGLSKEELLSAEKTISALEGTLGYDMDPGLRTAMTTAVTYQNVVLLPFALFASLVDPIGIAVRTGEMKDAWTAFKSGMTGLFGDIRGGKTGSSAEELAKTLGLIDDAAEITAYGDIYSGAYMGKRTKAVNKAFFRYNGMAQWNDRMRVSALVTGRRFLAKHGALAAAGNEQSERFLAEVGLEHGDVRADADDMMVIDNPKTQEAIHRFVDSSILRPNSAHRPVWGSDPHYQLLFHLKQFTHTFSQVIRKRVSNEMAYGNAAPAWAAAAYVPFMLASDLTKMVLLGRPLPASLGEVMGYALQRSGLLGVTGGHAADSIGDAARNQIPGASLLGPTFGHAVQAAQTVFGSAQDSYTDLALRSVPLSPLVKGVVAR